MDLAPALAVGGLERWRRRLRLAPQETVMAVLRLVGAYKGGPTDFRHLQVRQNRLPLPDLPGSLVGRRLLQVSDLHTDLPLLLFIQREEVNIIVHHLSLRGLQKSNDDF